jgi:hypothetical protein
MFDTIEATLFPDVGKPNLSAVFPTPKNDSSARPSVTPRHFHKIVGK